MNALDRWLMQFKVDRSLTKTENISSTEMVLLACTLLQVSPFWVNIDYLYRAQGNTLFLVIDYTEKAPEKQPTIQTVLVAKILMTVSSVSHLFTQTIPERMRVQFAVFV